MSSPPRPFAAALAAALALCAPAACASAPAGANRSEPFVSPIGLPVIPLAIETRGGKTHRFQVEVAATPAQQARGLMERTRVPPGTGMLFPRRGLSPAAFYMANTPHSLDIIFIDPQGRIESIARRTTPFSYDTIPSKGPVSAVLEIAAGESDRLGLSPGDRVRYAWPPERAR